MDSVRSSASELHTDEPAKVLEGLYRDSYRQLVRLGALLLGDLQRSEEIVQDVFVDLFQRWDRLRDRDNLAAYAKRAVAHAAVSDLRHRGVRQRHQPVPGRDLDSAEVTALSHFQHDHVMTAIGQLPTRQRQVLILRYYGDLSEAEIARALGVSPGAVKSHSSRALRALRPLLEAVT
jgi:RNA polymerase sigma-70 factor (sigma-E family)